MTVSINLFDVYRSANIGIFLKCNDTVCITPQGLPTTKLAKIEKLLNITTLPASVGGSRLIGPLLAMNNHGIVVSRLAEDEEVSALHAGTGLEVQRLNSRFTSVGNLISSNDKGAVISDIFGEESTKTIESTLQVPVKRMRIGSFIQVGSMIAATNSGALVHPMASEEEISSIGSLLGTEPEPATINGGVPFVSSGFAGNARAVLLGARTRGAELMIASRAFSGR